MKIKKDVIRQVKSLPQCNHMSPNEVIEIVNVVTSDYDRKIANITKSIRKVFGDQPMSSEGSMLVDANDYNKLAKTVNKLTGIK